MSAGVALQLLGPSIGGIRRHVAYLRDQLREALERATGKRLDLRVVVDPTVVGGVRAQVGDTVIDGSVRRRLDQLKQAI